MTKLNYLLYLKEKAQKAKKENTILSIEHPKTEHLIISNKDSEEIEFMSVYLDELHQCYHIEVVYRNKSEHKIEYLPLDKWFNNKRLSAFNQLFEIYINI